MSGEKPVVCRKIPLKTACPPLLKGRTRSLPRVPQRYGLLMPYQPDLPLPTPRQPPVAPRHPNMRQGPPMPSPFVQSLDSGQGGGDRPKREARPKVLVMGQSLRHLARALSHEKAFMELRWVEPNGLKRELAGSPTCWSIRPTPPSGSTGSEQTSASTRMLAIGARRLLEAQRQGADAVYCLDKERGETVWTSEQLEELVLALSRPIAIGSRRPIESTVNRLTLSVQGTWSTKQGAWCGSDGPVVLENTGEGMVCRADSAGRSLLRSVLRDTTPRTFGGVDHPLREVSGFLEGLAATHLRVALGCPELMVESLELLGREPRSYELHGLHPSLFWLIVYRLGLGEISLEEAARLSVTKQRVALGQVMGLEKACMRSINKVSSRLEFQESLSLENLEHLVGMLHDTTYVRHWLEWTRIPFVFFVHHEAGLARSAWLRSDGLSDRALEGAGRYYLDTLTLGRRLGVDVSILEQSDESAIRGFHQHWMAELFQQKKLEEEKACSSRPPVPATSRFSSFPTARISTARARKCTTVWPSTSGLLHAERPLLPGSRARADDPSALLRQPRQVEDWRDVRRLQQAAVPRHHCSGEGGFRRPRAAHGVYR